MSALAVALRVARRDAWRAKGRSALVLAMVALPVLGVTAGDVLVRTYQLDGPQRAQRLLGAADVAVSATGYESVQQAGSAEGYSLVGNGAPLPSGGPDPASVLPVGSRTVLDRTASGRVAVRGQVARAQLRELAYRDPVAAGLYRQSSGRAPAGPGEVALTTDLARRLDVRAGDVVELPRDGAPGPVTVVGTVADGDRTDSATVLLGPGGLPADTSTRLLVDLPGPLTWDLVRAANARGVQVRGRGTPVPGEPPAPPTVGPQASTLTGVGLVVGMALLEVVLLAGPAFAVGAKRQERVLALLRTSGADRRDVRRTVLAGGLVLGVVAGAVGALGGVGLAAAGLPLVRRFSAQLPGPFDVRPLEVLAVAVLGALTAVLAALLPALSAARQDVLAGLTGRRGVRRTSLRVPVAGLALAAAGTLLALQGARHRSVDAVLGGAALAELGLVATTPALVGLAGRLGPLLPAAPRLALRDAARNRSRTAPAVAAVLAAVAGSVAVATYVSSLDRDDDQNYQPSAAPGAVTVALQGEDARRVSEVVGALARTLPGARPVVVRAVGLAVAQPDQSVYVEVEAPADRACPGPVPGGSRPDPRCSAAQDSPGVAGGPAVGGPEVARALIGPEVPTGILDRGGALVEERTLRPEGTAVLVLHSHDAQGDHERRISVPAAALPPGARRQVVLSESAARALGVPSGVAGVAALPRSATSAREEDVARGAVLAVAPTARLDVERGYRGHYGGGLLALLGVSALLVLGASGIATGLAAADGRADLSTLAAVGASPGLRRRLAAAQSIVTAGLGTVLGAAAGLVPAVGLIRAINAVDSTGFQRPVPFPVVLPWTSIAVTVVAVPLLAGLLAALLTRSRLPLVRRLA